MQITILGTGRVGSAMIRDLAADESIQVVAVDSDPAMLAPFINDPNISTKQTILDDLNDFSALLENANLVINAVPGFMGFDTLKKIIMAGKNVVDIAFFPEDPFLLDELAHKQDVTAIVDCGVAPGLSNILAGYATTQLDQVNSFTCYVGGLPKDREWPYEYKAGFSPIDVLEEYTRTARLVESGKEVERPALSEIESLHFPEIGELEAFNTDGLRTLINTMDIPDMKEKTLRYPGHANLMRVFSESGFLNTEPIDVNGQKIRPLDLTSQLLFKQWKFKPGEEDLTIFLVIAEGEKAGKRTELKYTMLDRFNQKTQTTSMARTTGYTATIIARQVISGLFSKKGICPPEFIGQNKDCFNKLMSEYKKRNIILNESIREL
ncbi:saccharopine dehydrogenase NADP-binding domain-containing protein [candidate division KSB1 bacterium]|nr:saccharopine dehydrogenase NADP-binding domain-containing protein [candidate division KSB1 bacterium]